MTNTALNLHEVRNYLYSDTDENEILQKLLHRCCEILLSYLPESIGPIFDLFIYFT